jgi:hypothetical protein
MGFLSQDNNKNSFTVKTNETDFKLEQDVQAYKDYAAQQRLLDEESHSARQYRSYAILPDIVCIDILTKYGMDIHSPDFMNHPANLTKLRKIIDQDYPMLKTSTIKSL